jgi:hypothetical protein
MSRTRRPKGIAIKGRFTPILNDLHDSEAYRDLTGNAAKLYHRMDRVARMVALKLGSSSEYEVSFNYTYSEIKRVLGFSESTIRRLLRELWEKGFISVIQIGGRTASNARGRMSSEYQLCDKWKSYGPQWKDRSKHEPDPWKTLSEPKKNDAIRW